MALYEILRPSIRAVLALSVVVLVACSDSEEQPGGGPQGAPGEDREQPVRTEGVTYHYEQTFVEAVGTSRALKSVDIRPAVTGEVTEVNFETGEKVQKGQVLVRLDDRDERLAVELAEVALKDAERQLDRYRRSQEAGGVTQSMMDEATSAVDRARIALKRAQVELDYHTIEAPFSGYVGITDVDPGAWVSTDDVIATLDDRDTLLVSFQLPELLLGQLERGQGIQLSTWSDRFTVAEGEIVEIGSRVDETRRTFTLRAHVNNANDYLRPGMSFRIQLSLRGNRYPRVPEISLQWGGEGAYVWTVEDGQAKRVTVNVVQRTDDGVLVEADLPEGTPIVTEGVHIVRAGMDVRVLNAELGDNDSSQRAVETTVGEES
ncbi:efflux RND transporter periplasmic adaptor subunit [Marinimicrobium agarilyticum]|uniref:efflux RND transporter periplasmic adaptor subunit n=1 Tax=Marinimicrobium agarilyticum TaxID=306546 RepID=UPI0004067872|nr:efflux RND transporter periplasmic adaptor subunit [Marinimicrobium agarilyticum]